MCDYRTHHLHVKGPLPTGCVQDSFAEVHLASAALMLCNVMVRSLQLRHKVTETHRASSPFR